MNLEIFLFYSTGVIVSSLGEGDGEGDGSSLGADDGDGFELSFNVIVAASLVIPL